MDTPRLSLHEAISFSRDRELRIVYLIFHTIVPALGRDVTPWWVYWVRSNRRQMSICNATYVITVITDHLWETEGKNNLPFFSQGFTLYYSSEHHTNSPSLSLRAHPLLHFFPRLQVKSEEATGSPGYGLTDWEQSTRKAVSIGQGFNDINPLKLAAD